MIVVENPYTKEKQELLRNGCKDEQKLEELEKQEREYLHTKLNELSDDITSHAESSGLFNEEKPLKLSKSKIYKEAIDLYHRADALLKSARSHKQEIYKKYIKKECEK